jgi:hypothetical protein
MIDTQILKFMVYGSLHEKNGLTYHSAVLSKVYFVSMSEKDDGRITIFDNKVRDCKPAVIYL